MTVRATALNAFNLMVFAPDASSVMMRLRRDHGDAFSGVERTNR
jgi:hypothetical protein